MKMLTFAEVTTANVARCNRWHKGGINDWSPERWMTATIGELGEAANALKKLFRVEDEIQSINEVDRQISTRQEAIDKIAEEVADTFIYLNLFACRLGIDLAAEVVKKFNATSERYGFPERLGSRECINDESAGDPLCPHCRHIIGPDDVIMVTAAGETICPECKEILGGAL